MQYKYKYYKYMDMNMCAWYPLPGHMKWWPSNNRNSYLFYYMFSTGGRQVVDITLYLEVPQTIRSSTDEFTAIW